MNSFLYDNTRTDPQPTLEKWIEYGPPDWLLELTNAANETRKESQKFQKAHEAGLPPTPASRGRRLSDPTPR